MFSSTGLSARIWSWMVSLLFNLEDAVSTVSEINFKLTTSFPLFLYSSISNQLCPVEDWCISRSYRKYSRHYKPSQRHFAPQAFIHERCRCVVRTLIIFCTKANVWRLKSPLKILKCHIHAWFMAARTNRIHQWNEVPPDPQESTDQRLKTSAARSTDRAGWPKSSHPHGILSIFLRVELIISELII